MNLLGNLVERGGPVMYVIFLLAVLLYSQCARLLISVYLARRSQGTPETIALEPAPLLEARQAELAVDYRNRRVLITSMIAAAPLLGLLGTVNGMVRTFEGLSSQAGQRSMGDLAGGISEVLVATESGLAVAIPALAVVYLAHREMAKQQSTLNQLKESAWRTRDR